MTRKETRALAAASTQGIQHAEAMRMAEREANQVAARAAHAAWIKAVEAIPEGSTLRDSEEAWGLWSFKQSTYYGGGLNAASEYEARIRNIRECMNS
jgi:hypothetical protein